MTIRFFSFLLVLFLLACSGNEENAKPEAGLSPGKPAFGKTKEKSGKVIVFFGNSLTAAYGLDPGLGFTSLIQKRIDSLGLAYKVVNAGLSGETTAGGNERVDWILQQKVDVFVLELGANDGLRGIAPETSFHNLQSIINKVKDKHPKAKIVLAGMEAPPNLGTSFTAAFRDMYPRLARENKAILIPFLLEGVGGEPHLNQQDGIHPNAEGSKIVAENVWKILGPILMGKK